MRGAVPKFLKSTYLHRAGLAFVHDVVVAAFAFALGVVLRVGVSDAHLLLTQDLWAAMLIFAVVSGMVFVATNLYRGIWRYASLDELVNILRAATLAVLVFLPITFMVTRLDAMPRSSLLITWLVLIALLAGPRLIYRVVKEGSLAKLLDSSAHLRVPVLVIGAGDGAGLFIAALKRDRMASYEVLAVIDEKGRRVGRRIHGIPVLGDLDDLPKIFQRMRHGRLPQRLILTKDLPRESISQLLEFAERNGLSVDRLPRITDFGTQSTVDPLVPKPVAIEDLLRRPQITLDHEPVKDLIKGRRVLVTGAGGSIGGELVRQIAALKPSELVLIDSSELNLYQIDQEVSEGWPGLVWHAALTDVRDETAVAHIFAQHRPELVFHAAALKHVPIVEAQPTEGVRTNVGGTRNVAEACRTFGVELMLLVSTDKAVNPANVMGASKRLAEAYCQALDLETQRSGIGPRFVTVRFGNVLGSTGSIVPLFQRQLRDGGPLTVTHPEIARYFMTISEAVRLILQSAALGGRRIATEVGKVYVLEMGAPIKIVELAEQMIRLAGKRPHQDVKIVFTGLRPGEKLYEELFHQEEELIPTTQPGLQLAAPRTPNLELLRNGIEQLIAVAAAQKEAETVALLSRLVPEWQRDNNVVDFVPAHQKCTP